MHEGETSVAVIGLGGLGSATAYWLARSGVDVIGFEQFELGHVRGASHDHSRIIRRSYHTPGYVDLTAGAYDAWEAVERDGGATIITRTGGIDLFPPDAAIDPQPYRDSLGAAGVPYEWIDAAEVRRRWPAFARGTVVDGDVMAIHSPETGIVPAGRATAELQRLAVEHGAQLRERTPVIAVVPTASGEVDVITASGSLRCGAVVLCCDAWTNRLLAPLDCQVPLAVTREQVSYFPSADLDDLQPGRFPVWIWMDDPSYYGFPVYGHLDSIKAAEDCGGTEVDPDTRTFDPDPRMESNLGDFVRDLVGDRFGTLRSTTCLYTLTSDRDFVVDRLPGLQQIVVGLGAAHGFKFASWFGRELAELAIGAAAPRPELAPFAFDRPSLHQPISREAWLV
ncbi:FAD-dependent oxidoreductase [Ilumatobacter sp.]|uniref:FAD-dependent oxidoreductase n=1 Tax=Ilumatobacter sp. TaxID=1967498 RepID=UPI0037506F0F